MQNYETILNVLDKIRLPFGWVVSLSEIKAVPHYHYYIQIEDVKAVCNVTNEECSWKGRKWLISKHSTDGEIVQTVFKAVLTAMEHEAREQFLYRGFSIFDPHYDIDKLVELRRQPDAIKERENS